MMDARTQSRKDFLFGGGLAIGLLTLVVFAHLPGVNGAFVFDDVPEIRDNPSLGQVPSISQLLRTRSVTYLTLRLNYWFGGSSPTSYHLVNVAIHILNSFAVWIVLTELFERLSIPSRLRSGFSSRSIAYAIALLWSVHPITTQAVAYTIQRAESLWGLLFLVGWWLYLKAQGRRVWQVASIIVFWLAIGSKEPAVFALAVVAAFDWLSSDVSGREWLRSRWIFFVLLLAPVLLGGLFVVGPTLWNSDDSAAAGFAIKHLLPIQYWLTQPAVTLRYLWLVVWPAGQTFDYLWPPATNPQKILVSIALIGSMLIGTFWGLWRRNWWSLFPLGFFVCIATTAFVPLLDIIVEHRIYLASVWVIAAIVLVSIRFIQPSKHTAAAIVFVLTLVLGVSTFRRSELYASPVELWKDTANKAPWNYRAFFNIGSTLLTADQPEDSLPYFEKAFQASGLQWQPDYEKANVYSGYAAALSAVDQWAEAVVAAETAVKLTPGGSEHLIRLADVHLAHNHLQEAEQSLYQAIQNRPLRADLYVHLTSVLAAQKRWGVALEWINKGISLCGADDRSLVLRKAQLDWMNDDQVAANKVLGSLSGSGDIDDTVRELGRWLAESNRFDESERVLAVIGERPSQNPDVAKLRYRSAFRNGDLDLAESMIKKQLISVASDQRQYWEIEAALMNARRGELNASLDQLRRLQGKANDDPHFHAAIADVFRWSDRKPEAIKHYREAIELGQPESSVFNNLGALISNDDPAAAERYLRRAVEIDRSNFNAWHSLGNALVRQGKLQDAIKCYQSAVQINPGFQPARIVLDRLARLENDSAK
ncbi:tetratricopeptide repeat protein [Stieleria sp. JC731]|uniref:tetratricopeptide repeat protein n=1 Tax=Pirellulaceae TaxID=2691357 RepID=UPI001E2C6140|nr:tetratricopeptide repeat protein [Stieleria sp. JC731]MCC9599045.1 tetratricopeptide repeat protein [Stieleria sp. JC731]